MSKKKIRKKLINYRKKNFKDLKINFSQIELIINKSVLKKVKTIGAYYPINYEIDCLWILKQLEKSGHKISLPITKIENKMDFFEWSLKKPLNISKIGIPEPISKKKVYPDVILVPLVAFDNRKFRLGYGGGFYDRYIKKIKKIKKIITFGIAFSFQKVRKIPTNKYDEKLDYILTENYIK